MRRTGRNLLIISPNVIGTLALAFAPKPINDYLFWQVVLWGCLGLSVVLLFVLRDKS